MAQTSINEVIQRSLQELQKGVVPARKPDPPQAVASAQKATAATVPERPRHGLSEKALMVFDDIIRRPERWIEERCEALHIDRYQEWRARGENEKLGYLELAGRIEKQSIFKPTPKGLELARERGLSVGKFKSDLLHEVILIRVTRGFGSAVPRLTYKRSGPFNGRQPDVSAFLPGGFTLLIQVSVRNDAVYEAAALMDLAMHGSVDRVIMIAVSKKKAQQIDSALLDLASAVQGNEGIRKPAEQATAGEGGPDRIIEKIMIADAGTVLASGFEWRQFIEGLTEPGLFDETKENEQPLDRDREENGGAD